MAYYFRVAALLVCAIAWYATFRHNQRVWLWIPNQSDQDQDIERRRFWFNFLSAGSLVVYVICDGPGLAIAWFPIVYLFYCAAIARLDTLTAREPPTYSWKG